MRAGCSKKKQCTSHQDTMSAAVEALKQRLAKSQDKQTLVTGTEQRIATVEEKIKGIQAKDMDKIRQTQDVIAEQLATLLRSRDAQKDQINDLQELHRNNNAVDAHKTLKLLQDDTQQALTQLQQEIHQNDSKIDALTNWLGVDMRPTGNASEKGKGKGKDKDKGKKRWRSPLCLSPSY